MDANGDLVFLGRTTWRNGRRPFGIRRADVRAHVYIVGKTGTGKSTLLEALIRQDLIARRGCAVFDPHGDLVEEVRLWLPTSGREDVLYLNVPDADQRFGFNPLADVPPLRRSLAASGLVDVLKKIFADSWGVRLEYILRNAILLLLDQPAATISDIPRLFHDPQFRRAAAERATNPHVRRFWTTEFEAYPAATFRAQAISPIENKIGAFLVDPFLQRILTAPKSTFDLRRLMDDGQVLLVNLAKGKIGEGPSALFGALLLSACGLAGLSRADLPPAERRDFTIYADEFQTFTTDFISNMMAELRKYGVALVLANQFLDQIEDPIRDAVLGNAGSLIVFRVGATDAGHLVKEFSPEFGREDLIDLPNRQFAVRLMVDGRPARPFSGETIELSRHVAA
jgi:hypothetical protein